MSRIGNRILKIEDGVTVELNDRVLTVKGKKGELSTKIANGINVEVKDGEIHVSRENDLIPTKQLHGTMNANINNMLTGVNKGYHKDLEIIGVGYRFNVRGTTLVINAGYSHPVELEIPQGVTVDVKSNTEITVNGISKELVGEFAANIRKVRKPEPYKGKGIRYVGEHVRRKEGKKAK
jgi:large subunit ribosomal protein L6